MAFKGRQLLLRHPSIIAIVLHLPIFTCTTGHSTKYVCWKHASASLSCADEPQQGETAAVCRLVCIIIINIIIIQNETSLTVVTTSFTQERSSDN